MTEKPPERIYNWLDSQLSLARHYGSMKFDGYIYYVAFEESGQPLVRADVLQTEAKAKKLAEREARSAAKEAQGVLL